MQTPLSLQYLCKHPFGPISFWTVKEKLLILTLQKILANGIGIQKIMTARWIVIKIMIFLPSDSPILDTLSDFQPLVALLSNSCVFNDPPSMLLSPQKKCPQIALKMPPSLFFKVYFCHLFCDFVPTTYFYL